MVKSSKRITASQARQIDSVARDLLGIPTLLLMENAGRAIADEAVSMLAGKKRVVIFCGKGNNGGDGLVAARHLLARRIKPVLFLCGASGEVRNEAAINLSIWLKLKQKAVEINGSDLRLATQALQRCDLIIDALLGVGLNKEVLGPYQDLIAGINNARVPVLSVDIPSGLDATSGRICGSAVEAEETVTFILPKKGMFLQDGTRICGKIVVRDLGVPL